MKALEQNGKINVRVAAIVALVALLAVALLAVGWKLRKRAIVTQSLQAGLAAHQAEDWEQASREFQVYLSKKPNDLDILAKYAESRLNILPIDPQNIGAAVGAYRRMLQLDPGNEDAIRSLCRVYLGMRDYDNLAYMAERWLSQNPDAAQAALWLATAQMSRNTASSDESARALLADLINPTDASDIEPDQYADACRLMALLMLRQPTGNPTAAAQTAAALMDKPIARAPQCASAWLNRAAFVLGQYTRLGLTRSQALSKASTDLDQVEMLDPTNPLILLTMCELRGVLGEYDKAARCIERAGQLNDADIGTSFADPDDWRIQLLQEQAKLVRTPDEARQCAEQAESLLQRIQDERRRLSILYSVIPVYVAADQTTEARRLLDEVTASRPGADPRTARLEAIVTYAEDPADKWPRIIRILQPFSADPNLNVSTRQMLAQAYLQTGQTRMALKEIRICLIAAPNDPSLLRLATSVFRQAGEWEDALRASRALADHGDAETTLIEYQTRFLAATRAADDNALKDVRDDLQAFVREHPRSDAGVVLLSLVLVNLEEQDTALDVVNRALDRGLDEPKIHLLRIELLNTHPRSDAEAARSAARQAVAAHPEDLELRMALLSLLGDTGAEPFRNAFEEALAVASNQAGRSQLQRFAAVLALRQGHRDEAIESLNSHLRQNPSDEKTLRLLLELPEVLADTAGARELLAELREILGERSLECSLIEARLLRSAETWRPHADRIIDLTTACLGADPSWSEAAELLGATHEDLGNPDAAEVVYRNALRANPRALGPAVRLMGLLDRQGRYAEELELAELYRVPAPPMLDVRAALQREQWEEAIAGLEELLERKPATTEAHVLLARLLYAHRNDLPAALAALDRARKVDPQAIGPWAAEASLRLAAGDPEGAEEVLDTLVDAIPTYDAYRLRAAFHLSRGNIDEAQADFLKLPSMDPGSRGFIDAAGFHIQSGRPEQAVALLLEGLTDSPEKDRLAESLARTILSLDAGLRDRWEAKAIDALRGQTPDSKYVLILQADRAIRGRSKEKVKDYESALRDLVRGEPETPEAYLLLAGLQAGNGQPARASETCAAGIQANPYFLPLYVLRSRLESSLGNFAQAQELAAAALRLAPPPRNLPALVAYIDSSISLGQAERALETLEPMLSTEALGSDAGLLFAVARLQLAAGHPRQAETFVGKAVAAGGAPEEVLAQRVSIWAHTGDVERIHETVQGEQPAAMSAETALLAANILASSGQPAYVAQARRMLQALNDFQPDTPREKHMLASLLYQTGQADRAIDLLEQVVRAQPANSQALNDLAWILANETRQYDKARTLIDQAVAISPDALSIRDTRAFVLSNLPGQLDAACKEYEICLRLATPGSSRYSVALMRLGQALARAGHTDEALDRLRESLAPTAEQGGLSESQRRQVEALIRQLKPT